DTVVQRGLGQSVHALLSALELNVTPVDPAARRACAPTTPHLLLNSRVRCYLHRNPVEIRKTGAELPTVAVNANVSAADMETACPAFVSLHEAVPLVTVVRLQLRL